MPRTLCGLSCVIKVTQESFHYHRTSVMRKYIGKMKQLSQSGYLEFSFQTQPVCICRSSQQLWVYLLIFSILKGSFYSLKKKTYKSGYFWSWVDTSSKILWICYHEAPLILSPNSYCLAYLSSCHSCIFHIFSLKWDYCVAALESHGASSGPHMLEEVPTVTSAAARLLPAGLLQIQELRTRQKGSFEKRKGRGSIVILCGSYS